MWVATTVRAVAFVVLGMLVGGPVAATACELRCRPHDSPAAAAASAAPAPHLHHQHAPPTETMPARSGARGADAQVTAAALVPRDCCAATVAAPPTRFTTAPVRADRSQLAALIHAMPPAAADVAAARDPLLRSRLVIPLHRPPSVLRI